MTEIDRDNDGYKKCYDRGFVWGSMGNLSWKAYLYNYYCIPSTLLTLVFSYNLSKYFINSKYILISF